MGTGWWMYGRRRHESTQQKGWSTWRRGTLVVWSPHLAGRDAATWTDPLRFDPTASSNSRPSNRALCDQAWVPFGRGPHMCLGFALAQLELTLIISRLAQRLVAVSSSPDVPQPVGMVVNRPTGGALLHVTAFANNLPVIDSATIARRPSKCGAGVRWMTIPAVRSTPSRAARSARRIVVPGLQKAPHDSAVISTPSP